MTDDIHQESSSISKKIRNLLLLATIIVLAVTIYLMVKKPEPITPTSLQLEIQNIQKNLPIRIDSLTTLNNIQLKGMNIQYSFSVGSDPTQAQEFNAVNGNFAEQVEHSVKQNACVNRNTKRYISSGVSLHYLYVGTNGETVARFTIPAGFCNT